MANGVTQMDSVTPPLAEERRTPSPPRHVFKTPLWHKFAEVAIKVMALSAVAAIALIFFFVGREAIPMLWEHMEEVSFGELFAARQWEGYDEAVYIWQPVGGTPKYNVIPLFVGTLKVTLISMLISIPLGVGCAIYLSQYASRRVREI